MPYLIYTNVGLTVVNDVQQYLVQIRGEPAENAILVPKCKLSQKAKSFVETKSPPVILDIE